MPHQVNDDYLLEVTRAISQQCEQMHSAVKICPIVPIATQLILAGVNILLYLA